MTSLADNFEQAATTDPKSSKTVIRPQAPISSIAAGKSQFTAIADTNHGDASIVNTITREMDAIAKAGVKHLILEIPVYPVGHPARTDEDKKIENILTRMNAKPPQISGPEILNNQHLFVSSHDETPEKKTGEATAFLLIKAMRAGINVHFAGDDRGYVEGLRVKELQQERQDYIEKNTATVQHIQKFVTDKSYMASLGLSATDEDKLIKQMQGYLNEMDSSYAAISEARKAQIATRMDYGGEEDRAKRFADLANGEKAVLVFGADHFSKHQDLNEALDKELKSRALKDGTAIPAKTETIEIWASKDEKEEMNPDQDPNAPKSQQASLRIYADTGEIEIPKESADRFSIAPAAQAPAPKMERAP